MSESTGIEWADATFNPWHGCEKVSPGCAHCYAELQSKRGAKGKQLWGAGHEFRFFPDAHWAEPLDWARLLPRKIGRRPRVFCASMGDVFEDRPEIVQERIRLFALITQTPELDWLVLTKRPELMRDTLADPDFLELVQQRVDAMYDDPDDQVGGDGWLSNMWAGVSIENSRFTWRADVLREIPAAVRFISAEPLLGSLLVPNLSTKTVQKPHSEADSGTILSTDCGQETDHDALVRILTAGGCEFAEIQANLIANNTPGVARRMLAKDRQRRASIDLTGIDWLIIGGESGHGARTMRLSWALELVEAARVAGTAPFVKQLGKHQGAFFSAGSKGGMIDAFPEPLRVREFPVPTGTSRYRPGTSAVPA